MLLTAPASAVHHDRGAAQRQLNDLAIDLSRHDAQLESMVRNGNTVGSGWSEWFSDASHQLLRGRDAYVALNPQDRDLAARLGSELIDFTENGGRIASAQERGTSLAYGWSSALDSTISVVQEAASRLYSSHQPQPPYGDHGVVEAARAAADLARQSRSVIDRLPAHDRGSEVTKAARLEAYELNLQAQRRIEPLFAHADLGQRLRTADRHLTDANWQLARKPSPDGRFNGVDIPGARRDTDEAIRLLDELVGA